MRVVPVLLGVAVSVYGASELVDTMVPAAAEATVAANLRSVHVAAQKLVMLDGMTMRDALEAAVSDMRIDATVDGTTVRHSVAGVCLMLEETGVAGPAEISPCNT